jgi:nicotinate (nicotinamide) nucleotide adenylyltransferase
MSSRKTILKAVRFYRRSNGRPQKLGVLAGSFNPPTIAHEELVSAARFHVDEVLCVVPSVFPHKEYLGATLEQRLEMLAAAESMAHGSIATSEKGLFIDIARECQAHYGSGTRLYFICGRDAAERILAWDYGRPGVVEEMLREFELLVAGRGGGFRPPAEFQHRVHPLGLRGIHDQVSSTEVRERIARGEPWEHLVPATIVKRVKEIYS